MKIHSLKTWPEPFLAVWVGRKTAELRKDDREFALGDELRLVEWDPMTRVFSGRRIDVTVTHIVRAPGFGALNEGYVMLSFEVINTWDAS